MSVLLPAEAAERLRMGESTFMKHVADGDIRVILVGRGKKRRHIRIAEEDLKDFEDSRKCQFTPVRARPSFNMSSKSKVLDFEDLRRKRRGEQLKKRKPVSAPKPKIG